MGCDGIGGMKWDLWDGVGFMRCDGIDGMKCQSFGGGTRSDGPRLTDAIDDKNNE